jgi:hypothetical protein
MTTKLPNGNKIYQIPIKYTKLPQNIQKNSFQGPTKFAQIGIFGKKTYHLATLASQVTKIVNPKFRPKLASLLETQDYGHRLTEILMLSGERQVQEIN